MGPLSAFRFYDALDLDLKTHWTSDVKTTRVKAKLLFGQAKGQPFYIQLYLRGPHRPFKTQYKGLPIQPITKNEVEVFSWINRKRKNISADVAGYYNSVSRLDSIFGAIIDELDKSGELENIIVILGGQWPTFS